MKQFDHRGHCGLRSHAVIMMMSVFLLYGGIPSALAARYPTRPVRVVVPFAPGGGTDIIGRIIAQGMSKHFGRSFIVDNRPGAGGSIGTAIVAKAPADGYTLLLDSIAIAFNVGLYKSLPFDTAKDLRGITLLAEAPNLMVVTKTLPVHSFKQFVAYARAHPGKIAYGSGGIGTGVQLATVLLGKVLNLDMLHVPYKGIGQALPDLIRGRIQMMLSTFAPALPLVKSGQLRALAVTGRKRAAALPQVPTIAESGVPNYAYTTWYALLAPAGVSAARVDRIFSGTRAVLQSPKVRQELQKQGVEAIPSASPAACNAYIHKEIKKWTQVIRDAGIVRQ